MKNFFIWCFGWVLVVIGVGNAMALEKINLIFFLLIVLGIIGYEIGVYSGRLQERGE